MAACSLPPSSSGLSNLALHCVQQCGCCASPKLLLRCHLTQPFLPPGCAALPLPACLLLSVCLPQSLVRSAATASQTSLADWLA